ncbi:MAG TPA: glycine cleavage system protein GcvH [Bacillota bacterium]
MAYPKDFKYTKSHEFIKVSGKQGTVGLTSYAQDALGDIVFVELPPIGKEFKQNDVFAVVESVKAVSDCYCPAAGKVVKVNEKLAEDPALINRDPHGEGWIMVIELTNPKDLDNLMDVVAYEDYEAKAEHHH